MKRYYLEVSVDNSKDASSKAVKDCNQILKNLGFTSFQLNILRSGNKFIKKINNSFQMMKIYKISKNSLVIIPHPIYINKKYMEFIKNAKEKNNLVLVFLIHDLDSLRGMFLDAKKDFEWLDNTMYEIADYIIAHNANMISYLIEKGVSRNKIINLKIFDYLTDLNIQKKEIKRSLTLNIAGNLDAKKSGYLEKLNYIDKDIHINLYGVNYSKSLLFSDSFIYKGSFSPEQIPNQLNEGFGLVWDGYDIDGCKGNTGEYLKYNNPHKLSLYLISGLPVIIWSYAAEADFVIKNKIGLAVDNISDIKDVYESLTEENYKEMVINVKKCAEKVSCGYYLNHAIEELNSKLEQGMK